jgi:TrmH RNA methyltransferase
MDRVSNPHNFGAIVRSAAFLGVETLVLSDRPEQALPSPAAYRVAEGGLEFVGLWRPRSLGAFCRDLARHYRLIGAAARGTKLDRLPASDRPVALVLGNEETGLSPDMERICGDLVAVPGHADRVDSLNVSVAAGILIHALLRY